MVVEDFADQIVFGEKLGSVRVPSLVGSQEKEHKSLKDPEQGGRPWRQGGGFRKRKKSSIYRGRVCNISSVKAKHRVQVLYPHIATEKVSPGANRKKADGSIFTGPESGEVCDLFGRQDWTRVAIAEDGIVGLGPLVDHGMDSHFYDRADGKLRRSGMCSMLDWMKTSTSKGFGAKDVLFIAIVALQNMPRISGQPSEMPVTANELVQEFKSRWMLSSLMIISMMLQLVQICTGGTRKWYKSFQALSWLAYNTADAVAVYTLGALGKLCEERKQVYALWAAMLLFHLGGPDNISAYSIADAELWKRHGFQMLIQVITAFYVVISSADDTILWVSLVLAGVGTWKYAERTLALYQASEYHLDKQARPLYRLMQYEDVREGSGSEYNYFVLGEKRAYDHAFDTRRWYHRVIDALREKEFFKGMFDWFPRSAVRPLDSESSAQAMQRKMKEPFGVVMLSDLMDPEYREKLKHQSAGNGRNVVDICIAFALFKMFRRRLTGLHMHEWESNKIRRFFRELWGESSAGQHVQGSGNGSEGAGQPPSRERLVDVLDMELRFMFDSMFTKASGTAYTWWGPIFRGLILFAVIKCAVEFFQHWNSDLRMAGTVTWILFVSIILVEVSQLLRVILTDWTRVWLTCMYVIGRRQQQKMLLPQHSLPLSKKVGASVGAFFCKVLAWSSIRLLSVVNLKLFGFFRPRYWRHQFGQASVIPVQEEEFDDRRSVPEEKVRDFKLFLLGKVFERCELLDTVRKPRGHKRDDVEEVWTRQSLKDTMASVAGYTLTKHQGQADLAKFAWASNTDLENAIVTWQVATCLCEANEINRRPDYRPVSLFRIFYQELKNAFLGTNQDLKVKAARDKEMSQYMSRYTLYLLKERTQLLPSNAALAKEVYWRTKRELKIAPAETGSVRAQVQGTPSSRLLLNRTELDRVTFTEKLDANKPWKAGRVLAANLIDHFPTSESGKMWDLLANVWADLLITIAVAAKPKEHVELLTEGGEFITHIWLLLGHMGFGAGPNLGNMGRESPQPMFPAVREMARRHD